jgi:hypothetical protein
MLEYIKKLMAQSFPFDEGGEGCDRRRLEEIRLKMALRRASERQELGGLGAP